MSGKKAKAKRRDVAAPKSMIKTAPRALELEKPAVTLKLDLACGQSIRDGYEGVDLPGVPGVKHEVDLTVFPWPWPDSSVVELNCSHFVEHLPAIYVDAVGNQVRMGAPGAKDLFFRFFEECHRILVPDGWMDIVVPNVRCTRAFQDPTHRRFLPAEAFCYLSRHWRESQKLTHGFYDTTCDFDGPINPGIYTDQAQLLEARTDEVRAQAYNQFWNVIADWHARLRAIKSLPTTK